MASTAASTLPAARAATADFFWRRGRTSAIDVRIDLYWLLAFGLLLIAIGMGLRDPWPADEPRYALVARDILSSGNWLFPKIGGDLYADKPPIFFWMLAGSMWLTGSARFAFLLPSLLAALGTVALVYDLARRVWNREAGFTSALLLLVTFQFVWQGRQAQIDAVLCFWTTLSLYGLLRHLLLGPAWGWHALGWFAAGMGVITKGVGFLPLFILPIHAVLDAVGGDRKFTSLRMLRWWAGPIAFLIAVGIWLVPMLFASGADPELRAYRDEILFHQTIDRYADPWHHYQPFWYYVVQVIPPLWLPMSALIPWLWPRWRESFKDRDRRIVLPLLWIVAVVLFFSISSGKRGTYVLPAVPALAFATAPYLSQLFERKGVQRLFKTLGIGVACVAALAAIYIGFATAKRAEILSAYQIAPVLPLATMAVIGGLICWFTRRAAFWTYAGNLALMLVIVGCWIYPAMDASRSGARLVKDVEALARNSSELGLLAYKEQYLLWFSRPTINFGHARWRKSGSEADDAAAWLAAGSNRALLVPDTERDRCFKNTTFAPAGFANSNFWFVVTGTPERECVVQGNVAAALKYEPPMK